MPSPQIVFFFFSIKLCGPRGSTRSKQPGRGTARVIHLAVATSFSFLFVAIMLCGPRGSTQNKQPGRSKARVTHLAVSTGFINRDRDRQGEAPSKTRRRDISRSYSPCRLHRWFSPWRRWPGRRWGPRALRRTAAGTCSGSGPRAAASVVHRAEQNTQSLSLWCMTVYAHMLKKTTNLQKITK